MWSAHSHPRYTLREMKIYIQKNTPARIFIAALFVAAMNRKQLRCPPTKWLNKKLWYSNTMQYCIEIKIWTIDIITMCMNLKIFFLNKEARQKKVHTAWFHLYEIPEHANESMVTRSTSMIAHSPRGEVEGIEQGAEEAVITQGHRETCGSSGHVHNLYFGGRFLMCTHMSQLIKLYTLNMCKLCNLLYVNYTSIKPQTSLSGVAQFVEFPVMHQRVAGLITSPGTGA